MTAAELHDILYQMLCAIDDASKAENVSYTLGGGTMLGAVRHQDFIPWDDDADIAVLRENFEAFKAAMKKHLPPYYKFVEPRDLCPYFHDFVCRVQDTRYYWHEETDEDQAFGNKQNHICIDVFIIDNSANTPLMAKWYAMRHLFYYGLAMGHRYKIKAENYSLVQKLIVGFLSFCGRLIPMEKILEMNDKMYVHYQNKPGKYCIVSNDIYKYLSLPYEREWFIGTVDMKLRDRYFPVQSGYHEKLTLQYGDYMKPPADKSQFVKHTDLEDPLED